MRSWLLLLCGYKLLPHEVAAARHGFAAFAFVLSSYFILLPLREDVALTLGPEVLPRLFTMSLLVTALTAPLVTAYVVNPSVGSRAAGFRRLCRVMAGCLIGLWALLLLTAETDPWVTARLLAPRRWLTTSNQQHQQQQQQQLQSHLHQHQHQLQSHQHQGQQLDAALPPEQHLGGSGGGGGGSGGGGGEAVAKAVLSWYGNAVRVCFYVYLSLQSLLSTSTLWAVCADTFTAATSTKVYGFLGAGATLGQLTASAAALGFGAACRTTGATGAAPWLLLPAAALLLAAGRSCQAMAARAEALHPYGYDNDNDSSSMTGHQGLGSIGGGGGRGGSPGVAANGGPKVLPPPPLENGGGGTSPGPGLGVALVAAAGGAADNTGGGRGFSGSGSGGGGGGSGGSWMRSLPRGPPATSHLSRLAEGFRLIALSPYLLLACAFLALNYSTSATLYFLRAALVSSAPWLSGSEQRIAFFAALNTASAGIIFTAQMLLTGRVLTSLGVGPTLLVGPLVSLGGMALIVMLPSPATVAGVEVVRKVVQYSLARPSREALFTLVSRREKYAAKVVLDTVVQRLGDTAAAAVFQVVGVWLSLGPSAVAAVGLGLCGAHIAVSAALGRMYGRRKAAAAVAEKAAEQQQLHNL